MFEQLFYLMVLTFFRIFALWIFRPILINHGPQCTPVRHYASPVHFTNVSTGQVKVEKLHVKKTRGKPHEEKEHRSFSPFCLHRCQNQIQ
ncbi:hypothetical protein L873DRAFT_934346 [Choiromyces venosus 120613-1]|uniref:Uncharacterized protein n=1 Tax=Choiromyces venosus 120613-1 TaxID=1336337 RepID=A0A3N4JSV2_9PEZI|nr:hypothetical protein L873DRAFT_934346 [Choiromyces venosus 120613-1]